MHVEWYGQSAFRLEEAGKTIAIDPWGDMSPMIERGIQWDYPAIEGLSAELLLVTHEHLDHNAVEVVGGDPVILRSTAGTHESPIGTVVGIASEHDEVAGTERGPNTIFVFELDGLRVAHLGDFGQAGLRPEQQAALGTIDVLMVPVGGGPTIGADAAKVIADSVSARWIVPMHYRTDKIGFLEPVDAFAAMFDSVTRCEIASFETAEVPAGLVIPAAP